MTTGQLIVRVTTSRAKIPVEGATVLITDGRKKMGIKSLQITNTSGNIQPITVTAPDPDNSTEPSSGRGYGLWDVWVEHPDYISMRIIGVQVFPDVETIQPVELTPLAEGESSLVEQEMIELPTQTL
ncbi:MAG: spore cortex-lytic protein [Eubacteriales bacterium]